MTPDMDKNFTAAMHKETQINCDYTLYVQNDPNAQYHILNRLKILCTMMCGHINPGVYTC